MNSIKHALVLALREDFSKELDTLVKRWQDNCTTIKIQPEAVLTVPILHELVIQMALCAVAYDKGPEFWDQGMAEARKDFLASYTHISQTWATINAEAKGNA